MRFKNRYPQLDENLLSNFCLSYTKPFTPHTPPPPVFFLQPFIHTSIHPSIHPSIHLSIYLRFFAFTLSSPFSIGLLGTKNCSANNSDSRFLVILRRKKAEEINRGKKKRERKKKVFFSFFIHPFTYFHRSNSFSSSLLPRFFPPLLCKN